MEIKPEFDSIALGYSEKIEKKISHIYSIALLSTLKLEEAKAVLETAGGSGKNLKLIENFKPADCHYYLTDISPELIKIGINELKLRSNDVREQIISGKEITYFKDLNISLSIADGQALQFPDCSFDIYMSNMSLHHIPDNKKVISEAFRVLKEGGRIGITEFGRKSETSFTYPFQLLQEYKKEVKQDENHNHTHGHCKEHYGENPQSLINLLQAGGFKDVKTWYFTTPVNMTAQDLFDISEVRFPDVVNGLSIEEKNDLLSKLNAYLEEKAKKNEIIKFDQIMAIGTK